MIDGVHPPSEIGREEHLGVGLGSEGVVGQLPTKLQVVVDLAVEGEPHVLPSRLHGLPPRRREVDDAQAVVAKRDGRVGQGKASLVVWTPMVLGL